jgi:Rps23 Pro-64 3,4-dihydroxylase Tpa1-like proline 4-hydroxylase
MSVAAGAGLGIAFGGRTAALAEQYAGCGRVQIRDALDPAAAQSIYRCLVEHKKWNLVYRLGGRHTAGSAQAIAQWPSTKRRRLEKAIHAEARQGFQYYFASVPMYDIVHQNLLPGHFFEDILRLLNSTQLLSAVRRVVGDDTVSFADAQATRFDCGHFLTSHDDAVDGKNRRAAYVLNLTPAWYADWGGTLQFLTQDGNVEEGWLPRFNVLNVFRVPSNHSVSLVTPYAGASRYSITGWFRSGEDIDRPMRPKPADAPEGDVQ